MPESSLENLDNEESSQRLGTPGQEDPAKEPVSHTDQIVAAHVLFIDVVAYTTLKTDKAGPLVQDVFQIVSETAECRRAKAAGDLILLPSGDGAAVVFLSDPAAPLRCAVEIAGALSKRPDIGLRMGVNTGPASWILDINGKRIVAGAAISDAQRAMDCGDAGHILLTSSTAQFLMKVTRYAKGIHDLGNYEVKHGEVPRLFNFYTSDAGNPKRPSRHSIDDPRDKNIFGRIFRTSWSLPRALSLGAALVIFAAVLVGLFRASAPRVVVANLTPGDAIGISYPQFSPDGQWLAYASRSSVTGRSDVYVRRYENGQLVGSARNLTRQCKGDSTEPAFNPGGTQIAFSSESVPSFSPDGRFDSGADEQSEGIFVVNVSPSDQEGAAPQRVAPNGYNPVWSPNGYRILFASESIAWPEDRRTMLSKLSFVDMVGVHPRGLFFRGDAVQPSWSPNGSRVAFWLAKNGVRDIVTVAENGGSAVPVTNDLPVDWNPVWSSDGHVYFSSDRGGNGLQLFRIRVDESIGKPGHAEPVEMKPRGLGDGPATGPVEVGHIAISKDGANLAFIDRHHPAQLCMTRLDPCLGAACNNTAVETIGVNYRPATRPDLKGQFLVYNEGNGIFVEGSDGSAPREWVKGEFINRGPRWSPNGTGQVAFFSNRPGKYEILVGTPSSSLPPKQVTHSTGASIFPVWSPNGDKLAYTNWSPDVKQTLVSEVCDPNVSRECDPKPAALEQPPSQFDGSFVAWSWSSGNKLAGYRQRSDGKFTGIFLYDFDARHYTQLTSFGSDPIWLNDNHRLLFLFRGKIYVVDSALPSPEISVRLVLSVGPYFEVARRGFSISGDNQSIYFSREEIRNQLWIGTLEQSSNFSRILSWFNRKGD